MQLKIIKISLAISVMLALFLSFLSGALADGGGHGATGWMKSHEIERIDMVKTVTGHSDNSTMFTMPSIAVKGKGGEVATIKPLTPLSGSYNASYDMGFISTKGIKSADIAVRPYKNATLDVSGGTLVMSMKDIKVLLKGEDYFIFKFYTLGMYLPNGTGKEYKLEKPVRVIYDKGRKTLAIDAYPELSNALMNDLTGTATFPAGTTPVLISDIAKAEMSGKVTRICYTPPRGVSPTATPTATPTPTVSPTPTPTPSPVSAPVASFTASPLSGSAPLQVTFSDLSTNTPTSWYWDFGDGNNSTQQNPAYTYNNGGTYSVNLTATNAAGSNTTTSSNYITVTAVSTPTPTPTATPTATPTPTVSPTPTPTPSPVSAPVASFTASPLSGSAPLQVTFSDLSTNTPTSWYWDFGDGNNSTQQNPAYTYNNGGTYSVNLTATNAAGSNTTTSTDYITVSAAPTPSVTPTPSPTATPVQTPVASFTACPLSGTAPLQVTFTDLSTNTPTSWSWDFGDGNNSTRQNVIYTYSNPGNYTVSLGASNAAGLNTATYPNYITVSAVTTPTPTP